MSQLRLTESEYAFNKTSAYLSLRSSGLGSGCKLESVEYKVDTLQAGEDQVPKGLECHVDSNRASVMDGG